MKNYFSETQSYSKLSQRELDSYNLDFADNIDNVFSSESLFYSEINSLNIKQNNMLSFYQ